MMNERIIRIYKSGYKMNEFEFNETFELGKLYYKIGDYDRAEYYLRINYEVDPYYETLFYLGLIEEERENFIKSLDYFFKSVELCPDYGNSCNEIGVLFLRAGKEKEALYWLKRSIRSKINDALHISFFNIATLYKKWKMIDESREYIKKAIFIRPDFQEAIQFKIKLEKNS